MIHKFKLNKKIITNIVNQWDPIGLFPGAPDDEYSCEISEIMVLVNSSKDRTFIAQGILNIFTKWFGSDIFLGSYDECYLVAGKILESIK
jgi:hypothetical protein